MTTRWPDSIRTQPRRGIVVVLTGFLLVALFAFVSLSVDSGRVVLTQTHLQNAVDASALAASQEIMAAIYAAGQGEGGPDEGGCAVADARTMAAAVAEANGVYVDPNQDVQFGRRVYDAQTGEWPIQWDAEPINVVRVVARMTNTDTTAPDGELKLAFGWAIGKESVPLSASATAYVEARDLVIVNDFSASMNDDSSLVSNLSSSEVDASLDAIWNAFRSSGVTWLGTSEEKFKASFGLVNSAAGTYVSSTDTNYVLSYLKLNERNSNGTPKYPFPQAGRNSNGTPKSKPNASTSDNLWKGYINYVKGLSGTYKKKYGFRTLVDYFQEERERWTLSEDLWRTPHYPFHAVKEGTTLFLQFLTDLEMSDEVGIVSYATWAEQEVGHSDGEVDIDISDNPITADYATLDQIQRRHQAGHYDSYTGTGDGILKGREMLVGAADDPNDDGDSRFGARPTLIVMTDGLANRSPSGWSFPSGFSWAQWTDYDGDGDADYSTSDTHKKYAFYEATEAAKRGITIHTIAVGANADRDLMKAIAFAGGGIYINVPGGSTIAEMEEQMIEAFSQIAAKLPPPKLVYEVPPAN